ncbi:hypothetical protein SQ11_13360 [Nitrosospira sp. NpAV]|nr:hypothetical protein SQ11_13360 [Nitrosospira sp. NpAV]
MYLRIIPLAVEYAAGSTLRVSLMRQHANKEYCKNLIIRIAEGWIAAAKNKQVFATSWPNKNSLER